MPLPQVQGLTPSWGCSHPVFVSAFPKDMEVQLIGESKLPVGVALCVCELVPAPHLSPNVRLQSPCDGYWVDAVFSLIISVT